VSVHRRPSHSDGAGSFPGAVTDGIEHFDLRYDFFDRPDMSVVLARATTTERALDNIDIDSATHFLSVRTAFPVSSLTWEYRVLPDTEGLLTSDVKPMVEPMARAGQFGRDRE
jgi:hypothetical protein